MREIEVIGYDSGEFLPPSQNPPIEGSFKVTVRKETDLQKLLDDEKEKCAEEGMEGASLEYLLERLLEKKEIEGFTKEEFLPFDTYIAET